MAAATGLRNSYRKTANRKGNWLGLGHSFYFILEKKSR